MTVVTEKNIPLMFLFAMLIVAIFSYIYGYHPTLDTETYIELSDIYLSNNGAGFVSLIKSSHGQYAFFVGLVSILVGLFGHDWILSILVINYLSYAASGIVVYFMLNKINVSQPALVYFLCMYLLAFDAIQWIVYALSDSLYFLFVILLVLSMFFVSTKPNKKIYFISSLSLLFFVLFYRPTSITLWIVFMFVLGRLVILQWQIMGDRGYFILSVSVSFLGAFLVVFLMYIASIGESEHSSFVFDYIRMFNYFSDYYSKGVVVHDRVSTYVNFDVESYADFINLFLIRVLYFINPFSEEYSLAHNLLNGTFYFLLYSMSVYSLFLFLSDSCRLSEVAKALIAISSFLFVVSVLFHAATLIDYDWRYRAPLLFPLMLLASIGVDLLWKRFKYTSSGDL